jgi:hypothetical protein
VVRDYDLPWQIVANVAEPGVSKLRHGARVIITNLTQLADNDRVEVYGLSIGSRPIRFWLRATQLRDVRVKRAYEVSGGFTTWTGAARVIGIITRENDVNVTDEQLQHLYVAKRACGQWRIRDRDLQDTVAVAAVSTQRLWEPGEDYDAFMNVVTAARAEQQRRDVTRDGSAPDSCSSVDPQ